MPNELIALAETYSVPSDFSSREKKTTQDNELNGKRLVTAYKLILGLAIEGTSVRPEREKE